MNKIEFDKPFRLWFCHGCEIGVPGWGKKDNQPFECPDCGGTIFSVSSYVPDRWINRDWTDISIALAVAACSLAVVAWMVNFSLYLVRLMIG